MEDQDQRIKTAPELAAQAQEVGQDALESARRVAGDAKEVAADAAVTGEACARDALGQARRKMQDVRSRLDQAGQNCAAYIAEEPVKSVLFSAAGGALLATALMSLLRGGRRRYG